jgi:signal transduction histidine kinase
MLRPVGGRLNAAAAAEARRGRFGGPLLAALVVVAGLAGTGLVVAGLRAGQRESAERVMDQRTAVARSAVMTETERYRSLIEATAAGISTDEKLTWDDFDAASAPLASAGLIGSASVAYVVPSRTEAIPATQRFWRSRGAEGLVLRPAGTSGEHFFSIFTRSLSTSGTPLAGVDVTAAPEPAAALVDARRMGQPTVSDTYVLLRDRNLPPSRRQHSFVFVAPIWTRAPEPVFRGWIVLSLRSQDFLSGVLRTVSQGQLDGELLATDDDGTRPTVAEYVAPGNLSLVRSSDFPVADRQWTLITRADPDRLPGAYSTLPLIVLLCGLAITAILAGLVYVLATGRTRAWALVQAATADLREAEAESRRQAGLLGAIMATLGDGVSVVDGDGAFLLQNPAARQLLGVDDDVDGPRDWQRHYGLFLPDGRTPFPIEQLPLIRALRGDPADGVEMVIRNPKRPEGILVSVDGRPLDRSAGQHGAVAVFHDITELRRYENDLAVFAGVVAHDLKAPLSIVRGHCEAAAEDLREAPDGAEVHAARAALVRIIRAVDRMAGLIDTLLAYTTSRDAPLRLRKVELGPLVADVVHDRTAHLRPEEQPDVYVGPLPQVRADPAMLRHVLDNLFGNAMKYVRPGTTARVDVTAADTTGGWARIEIADRGIGVPDEDKPDIFERFHRSASAAGYAGTGLGLAICKRILERHGGEIGVADNPGGGTRVHFTLPAAVPEVVPASPAVVVAPANPPVAPAPVPTTPVTLPAPLPAAAPVIRPAVAAKEKPAATDAEPEPDDAATRAALARALAERADMENSRLPGLGALPAADPSAHETSAARLRAPVPDHRHEG